MSPDAATGAPVSLQATPQLSTPRYVRPNAGDVETCTNYTDQRGACRGCPHRVIPHSEDVDGYKWVDTAEGLNKALVFKSAHGQMYSFTARENPKCSVIIMVPTCGGKVNAL